MRWTLAAATLLLLWPCVAAAQYRPWFLICERKAGEASAIVSAHETVASCVATAATLHNTYTVNRLTLRVFVHHDAGLDALARNPLTWRQLREARIDRLEIYNRFGPAAEDPYGAHAMRTLTGWTPTPVLAVNIADLPPPAAAAAAVAGAADAVLPVPGMAVPELPLPLPPRPPPPLPLPQGARPVRPGSPAPSSSSSSSSSSAAEVSQLPAGVTSPALGLALLAATLGLSGSHSSH